MFECFTRLLEWLTEPFEHFSNQTVQIVSHSVQTVSQIVLKTGIDHD